MHSLTLYLSVCVCVCVCVCTEDAMCVRMYVSNYKLYVCGINCCMQHLFMYHVIMCIAKFCEFLYEGDRNCSKLRITVW